MADPDPRPNLLWDALTRHATERLAAIGEQHLRFHELVKRVLEVKDDPVAFRKAMTRLCDEEYRFTGDCEYFGGEQLYRQLGLPDDDEDVPEDVDP